MSFESEPLWYWRYVGHGEIPPKSFLLAKIRHKIVQKFGEGPMTDSLVDDWSLHSDKVLIDFIAEREKL